MSEHDAALSAEAAFGAALDDDLAANIPLVGFADDDAGGFGDLAFIGFDDEAPRPSGVGPDGRRPAGLRQRLGGLLRAAASAARLAALQPLSWLRYQLLGTALRARRSRAAIMVFGAILLSIGCGAVLRNWLPARQPPRAVTAPVAAPPPIKAVLVARQAIGRGHVLNAADLRWQAWPSGDIKHRYIVMGTHAAAEFRGHVARRPIAAGEPIGTDSIVDPHERGALAAVLPPGMRAVSVAIREENAASGLVMPGDNVDLLLTVVIPIMIADNGDASDTRHSVETVLSDVPVLAIDQETTPREGRAIIGQTATLEVTPKQAEIITLADSMAAGAGNLRLALRSLVRDRSGLAEPGSPAKDPPRNSLVDRDISKLMPEPTDTADLPKTDPLTIVRRGQASTVQPSPPPPLGRKRTGV